MTQPLSLNLEADLDELEKIITKEVTTRILQQVYNDLSQLNVSVGGFENCEGDDISAEIYAVVENIAKDNNVYKELSLI